MLPGETVPFPLGHVGQEVKRWPLPGLADTGHCDLGLLADGNATCCFQSPFKVRWSEVSPVGIWGNAIQASQLSKKRPEAAA